MDGKPTRGFPVGRVLTLAPGRTPELFIVTSTSSSQAAATITYSVNTQTSTMGVAFSRFNPCKCDPPQADPTNPAANCS
jgi:hypothetical protein